VYWVKVPLSAQLFRGLKEHSRTSTNSHLSSTATFFCLGGRSRHSNRFEPLYNGHHYTTGTATNARLNCSTTASLSATYPRCTQNPMSHCKVSQNLIHTARRWSLFLFGLRFIDIFWLCYIFIYAYIFCNAHFLKQMLHPRRSRCHITPLSPHNSHLSLSLWQRPLSSVPKAAVVERSEEVRRYSKNLLNHCLSKLSLNSRKLIRS